MSREFDGQILDRIANELELPHPEDFVLTGSGALAEWGIIPFDTAADIDGIASLENRKHLELKLGWKVASRTVAYREDGRPVRVSMLTDQTGVYDIYPHDFSQYDYNRTRLGRISLPQLKEFSVQDPVTKLYVASVGYLERTRLETDRPKDLARLRAIEAHRQNMS